jgi:3-methyladenine DNA glycosylase AlkD
MYSKWRIRRAWSFEHGAPAISLRAPVIFRQERISGRGHTHNSSLRRPIAVRVPVLRRLVKSGFSFYSLPSTHVQEIWDSIWRLSPYFEVKLAPLIYYGQQGLGVDPASFGALRAWIGDIENWAHCDALAGVYACHCHREPALVRTWLMPLAERESQWARRAAVVSLIHYSGKGAVYLPSSDMLDVIEVASSDQRPTVRRAVAWVLRELARVRPDDVRRYLRDRSARFTAAMQREIGRGFTSRMAPLPRSRPRVYRRHYSQLIGVRDARKDD